MHRRTRPEIFARAKELHRNMTVAEVRLWMRLKSHQVKGVHFRCQHAIGNYIVDFCAPRKKLIVELDGSQHLEQTEYDEKRTVFLESKGYRIQRFWDNDVMNNIDGVLRAIELALDDEK